MAIVKICMGQPQLILRVSTPGCDGSLLTDYENIRLVIRPPALDCNLCYPNSPIALYGCWPGWDTPFFKPRNDPRPVLVYDGFDFTENGEIVFQLDSKLWGYPPGRYLAEVETKAGHKLVHFDIDLCNQRHILDKVAVINETYEEAC